MPATHSFSLTPRASKMVDYNKYPRSLGGASKMVSDAIEFFWTDKVVTTGQTQYDGVERDDLTMECVNCGAKHYQREVRIVGDLYANINALQMRLETALEENEQLKNRKTWRGRIWHKINGSE